MRVVILALALGMSPGIHGFERGTAAFNLPSTTAIDLVDVEARYTFGVELQIVARLASNTVLQEAFLFYQAGVGETGTIPVMPSENGRFDIRIDLRRHIIPPFTRVYYWFHLLRADGGETISPAYWFDYLDNRFEWKTLEDDAILVHWYDGDLAFGQTMMNIAHAGLKSVQEIVPLPSTPAVVLYVYANTEDKQSTRQLVSTSWSAGYANPDTGVGLVSIPPGTEHKLEAERQIPHEIAHILLYRWAGANHTHLPAWLVEGVASVSELYSDPDYDRALRNAVDTRQLIPTGDLCQSIPQDPSQSFLAYAQSASFVRFVRQQYGTNRLQALIQAYIGGLGCEEGIQQVLQSSLLQVESRWLSDVLHPGNTANSVRNLLPYFTLLAIVLGVPLVSLAFLKTRHARAGAGEHSSSGNLYSD